MSNKTHTKLSSIMRIIIYLAAVKDSLTRDGHLDKFKAELRAAVINVLNNSTGVPNQKPPELPTDTKIMNDLIKEYLEWNGYRYTEQILSAGKFSFDLIIHT